MKLKIAKYNDRIIYIVKKYPEIPYVKKFDNYSQEEFVAKVKTLDKDEMKMVKHYPGQLILEHKERANNRKRQSLYKSWKLILLMRDDVQEVGEIEIDSEFIKGKVERDIEYAMKKLKKHYHHLSNIGKHTYFIYLWTRFRYEDNKES